MSFFVHLFLVLVPRSNSSLSSSSSSSSCSDPLTANVHHARYVSFFSLYIYIFPHLFYRYSLWWGPLFQSVAFSAHFHLSPTSSTFSILSFFYSFSFQHRLHVSREIDRGLARVRSAHVCVCACVCSEGVGVTTQIAARRVSQRAPRFENQKTHEYRKRTQQHN